MLHAGLLFEEILAVNRQTGSYATRCHFATYVSVLELPPLAIPSSARCWFAAESSIGVYHCELFFDIANPKTD
jgi:hypothetical protein